MASADDAADRLSDDVVAEILLRLPSAAVLRCRAVCRAWRRIATAPAFLAAHARRRPLELLLKTSGGALYTIPLDTTTEHRRRRRRLHLRWCSELAASCMDPDYSRRSWRPPMALVGACDGLLLFETSMGRNHLVCNPATRQCAVLPGTKTLFIRPCGLYFHSPSAEHRFLYLADDRGASPRTASHYVLSLGAAAARRLAGTAAAPIEIYTQMPDAYLSHRGNLHWVRHPHVIDADEVLAFDPVSETFRRISRPRLRDDADDGSEPLLALVEAHGALAVTAIRHGCMDLWVLEDYDSEVSSWRHQLRVELPAPPFTTSECWVMDVSFLGKGVILLENGRVVVLYDLTEKKVLEQIELLAIEEDDSQDDVKAHPTSFVFRESLERHAFFDLQAGSQLVL